MTTDESKPHSEFHDRIVACREQIEISPYSHTIAAGWYAEDVPRLVEQLEVARKAVQACYDDLQRYAPPHWRNQGKGEILARDFLTSFPASEPKGRT